MIRALAKLLRLDRLEEVLNEQRRRFRVEVLVEQRDELQQVLDDIEARIEDLDERPPRRRRRQEKRPRLAAPRARKGRPRGARSTRRRPLRPSAAKGEKPSEEGAAEPEAQDPRRPWRCPWCRFAGNSAEVLVGHLRFLHIRSEEPVQRGVTWTCPAAECPKAPHQPPTAQRLEAHLLKHVAQDVNARYATSSPVRGRKRASRRNTKAASRDLLQELLDEEESDNTSPPTLDE